MENLDQIFELVSFFFEGLAILVIVAGFLLSLRTVVPRLRGRGDWVDAFEGVRREFGRAVLLGLEFLVAADIIRTVALEPNLDNLLVLGLLVLIRTFLSWAIDVELEGTWPWKKRALVDEEKREGLDSSRAASPGGETE